jgi:hypothetical protein
MKDIPSINRQNSERAYTFRIKVPHFLHLNKLA